MLKTDVAAWRRLLTPEDVSTKNSKIRRLWRVAQTTAALKESVARLLPRAQTHISYANRFDIFLMSDLSAAQNLGPCLSDILRVAIHQNWRR